jgi:hypothetical protein
MDVSYLTSGVVGGGSSALVFGILLYVYKHGIRSECCGHVISAGQLDAQATPLAAAAAAAPAASTAVAPRDSMSPRASWAARDIAIEEDLEAARDTRRSSVHTPVRPAALRPVLPPLHPLHAHGHPETPMKRGRVSPGTDMYRLP